MREFAGFRKGQKAGGLATEDGPWSSDTVTYGYNTARERTSLALQQPSGTWSQTYGYDGAHRLTSVVSPAGTYSYTYSTGGTPAAASRLWTQVTLPNTGKITHGYDAAGRLTSTQLKNSVNTVLDRHDYVYNTRHERTKQTRADASYVDFTYDNLGQLQSARGYTSGGTPLTTEQKGYKYDAGWNLNVRTNNGFNTAFGVDVRNQLTTQPNGTATYDASGNLTGDGVRSFTYNAEQQLVSVSAGTSYRNDFIYDGLGRARRKLEYIWSAGAWSLYAETRYVYDGRRVVQERNGSDVPQAGYTWGQDVSGSLEGAGGIGGLLGRSHGYSAGSWSTHHHYHADGGGNVTALMDSAQALSANYRYDSYGNLLSSSGSMAGANLMRFSSKLWMASPGLYYYGFRFYEPNFQRWLNRDPIGEYGGLNLFGFVINNPLSFLDPDGQDVWIVKDEGGWGHEIVIGCNPDGTYWTSDKMPGKGLLSPLACPSDIRFNPRSMYNPTGTKPILPKNTKIKEHISANSQTDASIRRSAASAAAKNAGAYVPLISDCTTYAEFLARQARSSPPRSWPPPIPPSKPVILPTLPK